MPKEFPKEKVWLGRDESREQCFEKKNQNMKEIFPTLRNVRQKHTHCWTRLRLLAVNLLTSFFLFGMEL